MSGMWDRRLLLNAVLGLPIVLIAVVAGYAWDRWLGAALAVLAVVVFQIVYRLAFRFRARGTGPGVSALPLAAFAAVIGYATLGVAGLIFMGLLTWFASWIGLRT